MARRSPAVADVVMRRLERRTGVRWLVTYGDVQVFESSDEQRARSEASSIARTQNVKCFLSDEQGVRSLED